MDNGAKTWWKAQRQEGGEDNMWLDWEKLAPEDQAAISSWYQTNRLDPLLSANLGIGSSESRGFAPGAEQSETWKAFDPRYQYIPDRLGEGAGTYRASEASDYAGLLRGTDKSVLTGEGRVLGLAGTPLAHVADRYKGGQYDKTQVGLLNEISPDIAAKYGITDQSAQDADNRNWQLQTGRRNTYELNSARENATYEAILLTIAGGGIGSGIGAATGSSIAGGAAGGAVSGAASAQMNEQDVAKGAGKGALIGGVSGAVGGLANSSGGANSGVYGSGYSTGSTLGDSMAQGAIKGGVSAAANGDDIWKGAIAGGATSGLGGYINSNNLFGNDLANRFAAGLGAGAINSGVYGRELTAEGLLGSGASSAAGGLTNNGAVNQAARGLLNNYLARQRG